MTVSSTDRHSIEITTFPDKCPHCHNKITPEIRLAHRSAVTMEVFMSCPSTDCRRSFMGYYERVHRTNSTIPYYTYSGSTSKGTVEGRQFGETINGISSSFSTIYNQSYFAEQNGLLEICGVGYRKALEFLIKDYAKINHPGKESVIEGKLLAQCIGDFVTDDKIKTVAKRAVWLGNDETHYVRKWEGKNLEDLKKLIDLTVHWIEMEALTKSFELDMPD